NILLLLPTWLAGVYLARLKAMPEITRSQARLRVFLALAALFLSSAIAPTFGTIFWMVATWSLGHSHYALSYIALAVCFAYGLTGLRALLGADNALLEPFAKPIKWTADMSFSLYLLHWPLLTLLQANGVTAGNNPLGFLAIVATVVAVSGGFAALTENRRKPLRKALERAFSAGPQRTVSA
ncbi:MAG: acyltransferase family protein, partial [Novosphingobium sp.]